MPEPTIPTLAEGEKLLARYAKLTAAADALEADLAAKIAPLKKVADGKLAPLVREMGELRTGLEAWWGAHGATLTAGKRKSIELAGCVIGSRSNSKKLIFVGADGAPADDDAAIAALHGAKFFKLVKKILQLDRKAITARVEAEPEGAVAALGFSVAQGETFFVDPATRSRKA